MRFLKRVILSFAAFFALWIVAAIVQEPLFFLIGIGLGYGVMWLTGYHPARAKPQYHWRNLLEPFNALLVFGVIGFHIGIQLYLDYVGLGFEGVGLLIHLIFFAVLMPTHVFMIIRSVLVKKPKPSGARTWRKRRGLLEWFGLA